MKDFFREKYKKIETWAQAHVMMVVLILCALWVLDRVGVIPALINFGVSMGFSVLSSRIFWVFSLASFGLLVSEIIRRHKKLSSGKTEIISYVLAVICIVGVFSLFGSNPLAAEDVPHETTAEFNLGLLVISYFLGILTGVAACGIYAKR